MRDLKRNKTQFWYCLYINDRIPGDTAIANEGISGVTVIGDEEENVDYIMDDYGNETGETVHHYKAPVEMMANISPATGLSNTEQFGNLADYDKVIVTADMSCPIDENTVLFIDKEPDTDADGNYLYDYIVKRVAKSLNAISIAVSKVNVS